MPYTADEKKILSRFFTSTEEDVFVLINLPEVIKGTLFSRYSRTAKDIRRLFIDEFLNSKKLADVLYQQTSSGLESLNVAKAEDFYERILVGYGDDSVAELGGAHVALENISMLATKSIEEHRVGLSTLEKSTRYVYYDKKINGEYLYYKDPAIMKSKFKDEYIRVNILLFETYSKIVRDIQPILKKVYPGDENDTAYKFSIRAKACDLARGLLPLSTFTNMGVYGNGRAFEYLLVQLLGDPLAEVRGVGSVLNTELRKVIPAFVKRATNERGEKYREYIRKTEKELAELVGATRRVTRSESATHGSVSLIEYDRDAVAKIIAAFLYEKKGYSFKEAEAEAQKLGPRKQEAYLKAIRAHRQNRHHKPPRALEEARVTFDIIADWGVYKDLMRHRILSRLRPLFTAELGYIIPKEIEMTGFKKLYCEAMDAAVSLYGTLKTRFPFEAQYIATHGSFNRFYLNMNLREAIHLTELRSTPQGHPTYRKVAQDMAHAVGKKFPLVQKYLFPFVDYKDYELERLGAFKKIAEKAAKMGTQAFDE